MADLKLLMTLLLFIYPLITLAISFLDTNPTWHLNLIGQPTLKQTQLSPSLNFFRHSNSTVRLSGRLPSLLITATQSNVLAALNPRNGSLIWRVVLPITEPIIQHVTDLENGLLGLVSGNGGTTVRLINLADGWTLWERHLNGPLEPNQKDSDAYSSGISGVDVIFSTDRLSQHTSRPDLIIASRGKAVYRLTGDGGVVRWIWSPSPSLGSVARLLEYPTEIPNIGVLTVKPSTSDTYTTHLVTISGSLGELQYTRHQPDHKCRDTQGGPLIIKLAPDSNLPTPQHSIVCTTSTGQIASLRISPDQSEPLQLSLYAEPEQTGTTPVIEDVGLARHGILVARYESGQATVLRLAEDGSLQSAWKFTEQNKAAVFTGCIDREGLPYVSRASYSAVLGLGSLEILSLTSTDYTPGGMVTGQTFGHNQALNGQIIHIAVEVLQITNYIPFSRVLVVSDSGTLQLWQGTDLQWERDEDLASVEALVPYQPIGPRLSGLSSNLAQYLSHQAWELVAGFLHLDRSSTSIKVGSERVWYIGTTTGRLFAVAAGGGSGKVLWKQMVMPSITGPVSWTRLTVLPNEKECILATSLSRDGEHPLTITARFDLMGGLIVESSEDQAVPTSELEPQTLGMKILAVHDKDLGGSPARFLGNRGALFKYHNPNLAVRLDQGVVEVYDQRLGSLVWSFEMGKAVEQNSIIGALTENWLVLASREEEASGMTRLHSIEWYMSSKADVRLDGSNVNLTTCSRAYMVPYSVKTLGFSKSRLGVTSRALLVVNELDQIVSLSRRLLDCRRPLGKPSKEDMEEQLLAYDPVISLDPKSVITGDRHTAGLERVYSFSTAFESTSAVIGVGLDLFGSAIAPSRRFDQLGDEFNKLQLVLTTFGLLVGVLGLRPMVKNKQLARQWYS
ncbi:hypothetical protein CROQUDRAFT_649911 [Cronartium quercuum f. sp. fusiforme G11]|uniref:ER membrane protein complex subunit 1 n=1 Tax=Cronartium quercuum f. sp. fusiforme G11 TaxID=708437 RepID=A0A9P6NS88_9BASI|nr:hypothetical protein CROQUDRAFT_649911 [Cronartium quercuum f. sp. fusiforme G11]